MSTCSNFVQTSARCNDILAMWSLRMHELRRRVTLDTHQVFRLQLVIQFPSFPRLLPSRPCVGSPPTNLRVPGCVQSQQRVLTSPEKIPDGGIQRPSNRIHFRCLVLARQDASKEVDARWRKHAKPTGVSLIIDPWQSKKSL